MKSISKALTLNLLLLLVITSVIGFGLSQYLTSLNSKNALEKTADLTIESLKEVLELPLWNLDEDSIVHIGEYFSEVDYVAHIDISTSKKQYFEYTDESYEIVTTRESAVLRNGKEIGTIKLGITPGFHSAQKQFQSFTFMILLGLVILMASVGTFFMTKKITAPIVKLKKEVEHVDADNLDKDMAEDLVQRGDEIGSLAKSFEKMKKNLKQKIDSNNELMEQKSALFRQLAHDLKTPLVPIIALLPEALELEKNKEKKEILEIAVQNSNRLYELIKKTLSFVRIDSKSFKLEVVKVDPGKLMNKIISNNEMVLKKEGFKIIKNISKAPEVAADESYLLEVLENFVTNAKKFSKEKKELTFSARKEGEYVVFGVKDKGKGIAKENLKKIFKEFYKEDWSRHEASSGLGLSIAKKLVEAHKGEVRVDSEGDGKGAEFSFTVPIWREDK